MENKEKDETPDYILEKKRIMIETNKWVKE